MSAARSPVSLWCRTRSLTEVAAVLQASATRFGVVRLGSITRLDGIGLPTATAIRRDPIGESVSVCTGKGQTELEALVAALAEALERYCAEPRGRLPITTGRAAELPGPALDLSRLCLPSGVAPVHAPIDWCQGCRLDGAALWIPANAVMFPYLPSPTAMPLFAAGTHGLAAGSTVSEALVFALLECIERDAYARAVALATVGRGDEIAVVDPAIALAAATEELTALQAFGLRVLIRDLTCDTGIPVFLCTIADGDLAHFGVAGRLSPVAALQAAIREAAQSRLTDIQGAREDLSARGPVAPDPWFLTAGDAAMVGLPGGEGASEPGEVLAELDRRLRALSPGVEAAWVDLSLEGVDMAVVRAITPGLEIWAHDPFRVGPRAARWLWRP